MHACFTCHPPLPNPWTYDDALKLPPKKICQNYGPVVRNFFTFESAFTQGFSCKWVYELDFFMTGGFDYWEKKFCT